PSVAPPYAGGLAPFVPDAASPWDARRARHLLRRTGVNASPAETARVLALTPVQAAAAVVDAAVNAAPVPVPSYATLFRPPSSAPQAEIDAYNTANGQAFRAEQDGVFDELLGLRAPGTALRERLALALHAAVPTNYNNYGNRAHRLVRYWAVLRTGALGNYKTLIRDVGLTPAMLLYLNGNLNRTGAPNENYARELLELFTTGIEGPDGQPVYTQQDVAQLARCLTGWTVVDASNDGVFVSSRFDAGVKTVFGQTGAFGYDAAIDLVFSQRGAAVAHRLAGVLYRALVAAEPEPQVRAEMAAMLLTNGFQTEPVVRALLASRHFFSDGALGARLRSPVDLLLGTLAATGYSDPRAAYSSIRTRCVEGGFDLFRPPDVAGWPGGRLWLDTGRLPSRWLATDALWARKREAQALALSMPEPGNPYALVDALAAHVVAVPLSAATRAEAVTVMLGGIPDYEWNPTAAGAENRLRGVLQFFSRLPEAQLA
ncbi:MAG TPA: DUF1800 family protein, partial [Rubricoccaceae bacterium]